MKASQVPRAEKNISTTILVREHDHVKVLAEQSTLILINYVRGLIKLAISKRTRIRKTFVELPPDHPPIQPENLKKRVISVDIPPGEKQGVIELARISNLSVSEYVWGLIVLAIEKQTLLSCTFVETKS